MAWNQNAASPSSARNRCGKRLAVLKGAVAGFSVIGIASIALWHFNESKSKQNSASDSRPKTIAEAKPSKAPKKPSGNEVAIDPELTKRIRQVYNPFTDQVMTVTQKVVKLRDNASRIGQDFPGNKHKNPKRLYDTFAENYVVGLMRCEPGTTVVGMRLPKNFDEQFIARIADPIGFKDDDTDEDRALRQQMHDFKKEVAGQIADGRKPSEIVLEARKELRRISELRTNLQREISQARKRGESEADIKVLVDAANSMLEKEGAKKIKYFNLQELKAGKEIP